MFNGRSVAAFLQKKVKSILSKKTTKNDFSETEE